MSCNNELPKFTFKCSAEQAESFKQQCSEPSRNISMREYIDRMKRNKYCPPLDTIKVTFAETGKVYTLAELDQMLNN